MAETAQHGSQALDLLRIVDDRRETNRKVPPPPVPRAVVDSCCEYPIVLADFAGAPRSGRTCCPIR